MNPGNVEFRSQRGTPERWALVNPVLGEGEPGYERGTGLMKWGDGVTPWNDLDYYPPGAETPSGLQDHIDSDLPHPIYDDGPSLALLYENAKV